MLRPVPRKGQSRSASAALSLDRSAPSGRPVNDVAECSTGIRLTGNPGTAVSGRGAGTLIMEAADSWGRGPARAPAASAASGTSTPYSGRCASTCGCHVRASNSPAPPLRHRNPPHHRGRRFFPPDCTPCCKPHPSLAEVRRCVLHHPMMWSSHRPPQCSLRKGWWAATGLLSGGCLAQVQQP